MVELLGWEVMHSRQQGRHKRSLCCMGVESEVVGSEVVESEVVGSEVVGSGVVEIGWIGCRESSICHEGDFEGDAIVDQTIASSGSQCYRG